MIFDGLPSTRGLHYGAGRDLSEMVAGRVVWWDKVAMFGCEITAIRRVGSDIRVACRLEYHKLEYSMTII